MKSLKRKVVCLLFLGLLLPWSAEGQEFKKWEAEVREYKEWLGVLQSGSYRFWIRLDSNRRPHRLYVGEGFYEADSAFREAFVEIFSHTLAGHPEKYMLIDIFDAATEKPIGEYGWGGFKLY